MPFEIDSLPWEKPTEEKKGFDLNSLPTEQPADAMVAPVTAPSPGVPPGFSLAALPPNPDLDQPDIWTPKAFTSAIYTSLMGQFAPLGKFVANEARGAVSTVGRVTGAAGFVLESLPATPIAGGMLGKPLSSLGATISGLADTKKTEDDSWFTYDLPRGIGSGLAYLGVGAVTGGAGVAVTGALDQGEAMRQDAVARGASVEQQQMAFLTGNVIGSAEAIPMNYFLGQVNKFTGGAFWETLKGLGTPTVGALKEALKGAVLEGTTEAAQQLAENWVAKDLVAYDPTRTLDENLWSSFITGGAVGSLFAGSIGVLNKSAQREALEKVEVDAQARLATGDPINNIVGPFSTMGNLPAMQAEKVEVEGELRQAGRDTGEYLGTDFPGIERQMPRFQYDDPTTFASIIGRMQIDKDVEKGHIAVNPTATSVSAALEHTPVVTSVVDPYEHIRSVLEQELRVYKKFEQTPAIVQGIERVEAKLEELKEKTALSKTLARHMKDYVAAYRSVLDPEARFVVSDYTAIQLHKGGALGSLITFDNVPVAGKPTRVYSIHVDFDALATARYNEAKLGKAWYSTPDTQAYRRKFFEVLNHELGHTFVFSHVVGLMHKAGQGDLASKEMFTAIKADYDRWIARMEQLHIEDYNKSAAPPSIQVPDAEGEINQEQEPDFVNYLFSFDEYHAQQMARLATQGKLQGEEIITRYFQPLLKQYQEMFTKLPQFAKQEYGNFEKFIRRQSLVNQIAEEIEANTGKGPQTIFDAIKGLPGFDAKNFEGFREHLDRWTKVMDYGFNLIQIAKLNPHIVGLQGYLTQVRRWQAYSRMVAARSVETVKAWRDLGKEKANNVATMLLQETERGKLFTAAEVGQKLKTLEEQKVYAQVRADFNFVLAEMQTESLALAMKNFPDNEVARGAAVAEITGDFEKMKGKAYFPYMRFGKWINTVRAAADGTIAGTKYKKGEVVEYEAYESQKDRDQAAKAIAQKYGAQVTNSPSVQKESSFVVQGLPAAMLRAMKERIPNLTHEQTEEIDKALQDLAPYRGLKAQFLKRRGVAGYSLDAQRSYAQYMRMAAGHLSRIRYSEPMQAAVNKVNGDVKVMSLLGRDSTKRQMIGNWMSHHFDYIMNPVTEWTGLRSAVFSWFLGFNVKSALVNLSQVPMVTYPYLAARYGDIAAARELASANTAAISLWRNREKWTHGSPGRQRIVQLLEQGKKDGWLDQALATELAIAASEGTSDRGLTTDWKSARSASKHLWYKWSEYGAKPFAVAEKINRTITAIAAYNLSYARSQSHTAAYNAARDAVDQTQYENSRWNRPRFMRGKFGTLFIFQNYVQNTLVHMVHDPGGRRSLMMMFLMAGVMGLPGAENAEDIVDWLVTKVNGLTGAKNPKMQIRVELREALQELGMNPDLVLHGLAQSSFGLPALSQMVGLPLPEFDLSGSLGMGKLLPGTSLLRDTGQTDTSNAALGQAAVEAGGAGASAFESILRGIYTDEPSRWKRAELFMPTWMKQVSKASRYTVEGQEKTARGDVVASFDPYNPVEALELFGQSLGFTPTEVTEGWERLASERESVNYYRTRMEGLLKQHNWAFVQEDREAVSDARQRIKEFNDQVPYPEMRIGTKTIRGSLSSYVEAKVMAEKGIDQQKRYIRLRQEIQGLYAPQASQGNADTGEQPPP